ncbi:hypothetical protein phytr_3610 [Candidatus Phycorickettsia trachydisci]|uniref:Phosphatidic acid phosphatase type 2/haloperoxidase domain-containing protein n=1 Tax=Candidatus Phycorickettsia trachydisci TaxID=2115978 RepID=A0A2P1P7R8_9RICK|nr:phosphatase PAP2 family protein [Candidatus Phycorickettsia trachydisci]AVP87313.1 hypothetical protein phytr_3610 [Candidatus Phycorickettsia trachydisci]
MIAEILLSFSHETVLVPLVVLGYIWISQRIFFNAICLILINMLISFVLKNIFQIPLNPNLEKQGYAFPSGHMQSCIVVYGYLMKSTPSVVLKILIVFLLIGVGQSLVYMGYHNYFDVLGAIFFGSILVLLSKYLSPKTTFVTATLLLLYILLLYQMLEHLWLAYYGLIGIISSYTLFAEKTTKINLKQKVLATALCFGAIFGIKTFFGIFLSHLPPFISQIQWILIGFVIPYSTFISLKTVKN